VPVGSLVSVFRRDPSLNPHDPILEFVGPISWVTPDSLRNGPGPVPSPLSCGVAAVLGPSELLASAGVPLL
jgi:hypothetical protein